MTVSQHDQEKKFQISYRLKTFQLYYLLAVGGKMAAFGAVNNPITCGKTVLCTSVEADGRAVTI
jgi:hypothetical protein